MFSYGDSYFFTLSCEGVGGLWTLIFAGYSYFFICGFLSRMGWGAGSNHNVQKTLGVNNTCHTSAGELTKIRAKHYGHEWIIFRKDVLVVNDIMYPTYVMYPTVCSSNNPYISYLSLPILSFLIYPWPTINTALHVAETGRIKPAGS